MRTILEVTGGKGGNAYLVAGKTHAALIDCGMAYCAAKMIGNIRDSLGARPIDYIMLSHSHYDHVGAVPYLKAAWPDSQVLAAEQARHVLSSPRALKTIRDLGMQAARVYRSEPIGAYEDRSMQVDRVIGDGDQMDLGGTTVSVLATPGHTRCSLTFTVNATTLFASESTGYMSKSGKIYPSFITSYADAVDSIRRCRDFRPKHIFSPHYGQIAAQDVPDYWDRCLRAAQDTADFVRRLSEQGYDEEQILAEYEKKFRDAESRLEQPLYAFRMNTQFMIRNLLQAAVDGVTVQYRNDQ